jgi:hypothetical protein
LGNARASRIGFRGRRNKLIVTYFLPIGVAKKSSTSPANKRPENIDHHIAK